MEDSQVIEQRSPEWHKWRDEKPRAGWKFIVALDDGCSSGIYVMLDDGPYHAEDGQNYGMDEGAIWMRLPDSYAIHFMEVAEDDWY